LLVFLGLLLLFLPGPANLGNETPARPRADRPVRWAPGVWHDLLAQQPVLLDWPRGDSDTRVNLLEKEKEVSLDCIEPRLLQLGLVTAPRYILRMKIRQAHWGGGWGVFYGHQETEAGQGKAIKYQFVEMRKRSADQPTSEYFLYGGVIIGFPDGTRGSRRFTQRTARIEVTRVPAHSLELTIGPLGLEKALWDQQALPQLAHDFGPPPPPVKDGVPLSAGGFGVYCEAANVRFQQPQIQIVKEEAHAQE
jgi:hypothetical protein